MPEFTYDPPLPAPDADSPFLQTIRAVHGKQIIGTARWHVVAPPIEGVAQLIEVHVQPPYRRQGHGGRLVQQAIAQAAAFFASRQATFRRVWTTVQQKNQVIARAFLTAQGFHHTATVKDLLRSEDLLIYVRGMD